MDYEDKDTELDVRNKITLINTLIKTGVTNIFILGMVLLKHQCKL